MACALKSKCLFENQVSCTQVLPNIGKDTAMLFLERNTVHLTQLLDISSQFSLTLNIKIEITQTVISKSPSFCYNRVVIFGLWTLEITSSDLATCSEVQEWQSQKHKPSLPSGFWTLPAPYLRKKSQHTQVQSFWSTLDKFNSNQQKTCTNHNIL